MSSESKQRKQRGQQQTRFSLALAAAFSSLLLASCGPLARGNPAGLAAWHVGNRRREARGRRRCKADLDLALRLARRPASFSVGRRAAFSQRQQAVQPVLRQRIRPRLPPSPFSSCGRPSAAAAACSASARKSACEAKRNLGCRGLGGALAHPLLPERSGVPRGPLGSSEGLACPEPRRGRQR